MNTRNTYKAAAVVSLSTLALAALVLPGVARGNAESSFSREVAIASQPAPPAPGEARSMVTVVGEGVFTAKPDRVSIRLGVTSQAETAAEAQGEVNDILTRAIKAIRDVNTDGERVLQTAGISLSPVYTDRRSREEQPRIAGYRASNSITVRIDDIEKIGDVLDAAVKEGANEIQSIQFMFRNQEEAQAEALARAVKVGKYKARVIADAMEAELGRSVRITEEGSHDSFPTPRGGAEMMRMASMDVSTPIEAGELTVRARVTMVFELGGPMP